MGPYALFQADRHGNRHPPAAVLARHGDPAVHVRQHQDRRLAQRGVAGAPARPRPRLGVGALGPGLGPDRQVRVQPERLRRLEHGRQQPRAPVRDRRPEAPGLRPGPRRRPRRDHRGRRRAVGRRATRAPSGRRSPAAGSATAPCRARRTATTTRRRSTRIRTASRASSTASRTGRRSTPLIAGDDPADDLHGSTGQGELDILAEQLAVLPAGRLHHAADGRPGVAVHHAAADPGRGRDAGRNSSFDELRRISYTFPWKTLPEWDGTCREFVLTRNDGVQHRAYFRFSKARRSPSPATSATRTARRPQGRRSR